MTTERSFPGSVNAVGQARRFILDTISGIDPEVADEIAIMVSELTTNSVRHASTPFTLTIDKTPREIYVAVTDNGPGAPVVRDPTPSEFTGRGLQIVRALARRWGVRFAAGTPGKTVWFTMEY